MILAIISSFAAILCILGICELLFGVKMITLCPKKNAKKCLLIELSENDCVYQLACAVERMNWYGNIYECVIALTDNLSEKSVFDCKKSIYLKRGANVLFCNKDEIKRYFDLT